MSFYPFINKNNPYSVLLTKYSILKCVYNAKKKNIKNKKKLKMDADVF